MRGYQDLPELPQLLESCGWALIPIGPERSRALFIVSPANTNLVTTLRERGYVLFPAEGANYGVVRWLKPL